MTKKMYDIIRKSHKAHSESKPVWVIGAWDLDIVCYLLFGAWDFLHPWINCNLVSHLKSLNIS
jgi:hypothetical protein